MIKHAINSFLATSISFANEIGLLCDSVGADGLAVAQALRMDPRIGAFARVDPGLGFSGGTLARDVQSLRHLGKTTGQQTLLLDAVLEVNRRQNGWVFATLSSTLDLAHATVGVLGLTYTPNTSTLRRSSSLEIIASLRSAGATVKAYDPEADLSELTSPPNFEVYDSPYDALVDCDALVIGTEWPEFKGLDFARLRSIMKRPLMLDPRHLLATTDLAAMGFEYIGIGRGHLPPRRVRATRRAQEDS
jgi:UDPglucose 6-dehydrogenase